MDLNKIANNYSVKLTKLAAKDKLSRGKVSKSLEKDKAEYSKMKKTYDSLVAERDKLNEKVEALGATCQDFRKKIIKMHGALQKMDLSNASDAIFYDTADIGYVIDGKEYHLEVDDMGDMKLVPMRQHRSSKKKEEYPEADDAMKQQENGEVFMEADDQLNADLDNLYDSLIE